MVLIVVKINTEGKKYLLFRKFKKCVKLIRWVSFLKLAENLN